VRSAAGNAVERLEQRRLLSGDFDWQTLSNLSLPTQNFGEAAITLPTNDANAGKIVVTGYLQGGDTNSGFLMRYNANGTPDGSFAGGAGIVRFADSPLSDLVGRTQAFGLQIQNVNGTDELLVSIACRPTLNQDGQVGVLRFTTNGSLDTTFGNGGLALPGLDAAPDSGGGSPSRAALAVDSQGRIVVTGELNNHTAVARFDSNGLLDPNFGLNGVAAVPFIGNVTGVGVDSQNRVAVGGYGNSLFEAAQLDTNGNVNWQNTASFAGNALAFSLVVDSGGNVVLGGATNASSSGQYSFALARFSATDGSLDPGFGTGGTAITEFPDGPAFVRGLALNGNDIVAVGTGPGHTGTIVEYQSNGSPDPKFNNTGIYGDGQPGFTSPDDQLLQADIASNGEILATGRMWPGGDESMPADLTVQEFSNNTGFDQGFGASGTPGIAEAALTGPSADVGRQMTVDPLNGNITVYGTATGTGANSYFQAAYDPIGTLITVNQIAGLPANDVPPDWANRFAATFNNLAQASAMLTDSSGNVIVGGTFNGDSFGLARYIQDAGGNWVLDPTFNPSGTDSDGRNLNTTWGVSVPGTVITHFGGVGTLHALGFDGGIVAVGGEG
jgi:uncharacterized delta-60 repeat protein